MSTSNRCPAFLIVSLVACLVACQPVTDVDLVIRDGTIYDGDGGEPYVGDVAVSADRIVGVGELGDTRGAIEIDASGLAVAPGFINMLSWATSSLIEDGRALSDVSQGVTLEVFGEGWSMGPLNASMKEETVRRQGDIKFDVEWTTLAEYLDFLVEKGISPNVASFVGATTVRIHTLGYEDRPPTEEELETMREMVRVAMEEGALGVGSSLIYAPAFYADTSELTALAEIAGQHGGMYISHIRSEGEKLEEAVTELISIARLADLPAEIYHLKAAGEANFEKLERVFALVEQARQEGLRITADMYTYTAGATGLDAAMPPWVQEGGHDAWVERLKDSEVRSRVALEMATPTDEWENLLLAAGSADNVLLVGFKNDSLKELTGQTLTQVAAERGKSVEETVMDLVIEDDSRVGTVYFIMDEENVRRKIARPWVSFCSDAGAPAPEGTFLRSNPHPRAYGTFARLLGRYVRDVGVISLAEAVRRLSSMPADNLNLRNRGRLVEQGYADIVVFDPATITDRATYAEPHQLASGVVHVFVNGEQVVQDGSHTGATPGRVVRGPGWTGWAMESD